MHADRQARDTSASESKRDKTFRDKYGYRIADSILLLMRAMDEDFLPSYYQSWGGGRHKGESERVLLQREVDQSADALGVLPFKIPPLTSHCTKDL
jgi:hypothetical protein